MLVVCEQCHGHGVAAGKDNMDCPGCGGVGFAPQRALRPGSAVTVTLPPVNSPVPRPAK